jgi:polyketide synthase 12
MSAVADDAVYGLDWVALAPSGDGADVVATDNVTVLRCPALSTESMVVADGTRRTLAHVLDRVQRWLSSDSHDDNERLVVLTHGAIAVDSSEDVTDLAQAAVWGLLRSAQTENPGRIVLADIDDWAGADVAVAETLSRDESQLALRNGVCFAPRMVRVERIEGAELVERDTWRLSTLGTSTLDSQNFALRPWPESKRPLMLGQVRIGLRSSGVNFRDI